MENADLKDHELLESLVDGRPIDWARERRLRPARDRYLDELRTIESIIRANREVGLTGAGATAGRMAAPTLPIPETRETKETKETKDIFPPPSAPRSAQAPHASKDPRTEKLVPRIWGRLQILGVLGSGSYGEVWKAHDPVLDRVVALKLRRRDRMESSDEKRFIKEAQRLAKVRHENVLAVHGADVHDGLVGIWTDFLDGKSLEDLVETQGPYGYREATLIGMDLCRALSAVHAAGLVHRDVKPANVMKTADGRVVLVDFGAVTRDVTGNPGMAASAAMGTLVFVAPEILLGEPATPQSDVYSLGVLLFRLVTGSYPVVADTVFDMAKNHAEGNRTSIREIRPDIPYAFVEAVEGATKPDRDERFRSMADLERSLARVLALPEPAAKAKERSPLRFSVAAAAAAAAAAAVVSVGLFATRGATAPPFQMSLARVSRAGHEKLGNPATVTAGDQVFLEYRSKKPSWVYVVDEDADGRAVQLYPLSGLPDKPLKGGVAHHIPEDTAGAKQNWTIDPDGGNEMILAVASETRIPALEKLLVTIPGATTRPPAGEPGPAGDVAAKSISHYTPATDGASFLDDFEEKARQSGGKVLVQRFTLARKESPTSKENR